MSSDRSAWVETRTDDSGEYRVDRLRAGHYRVSLLGESPEAATPHSAGFYRRLQIVFVAAGETARVDFEGTGALSGTVRDERGDPLPGVTVEVYPLETGTGYRQRAADAGDDGSFRIENAGAGWHKVRVNHKKAGWSVEVATLNLSGYDQEVSLELPPGQIDGRITLGKDGIPPVEKGIYPGITLRRLRTDRAGATGPNLALAFPDRTGRFDMRGIPEGEYRLSVRVDGYHPEERDVVVSSGKPPPQVDFVLREYRVGTVRLRILGPAGGPAEGVYFSERADGGNWRSFPMERPEPGVYTSDKVPVGTRQFILHRQDLEPEIVTLEVSEDGTAALTVSMTAKR
jgi:hypothetical protein